MPTMTTSPINDKTSEEKITINNIKQKNIANKKIYFDSDGTEVKIWYDNETGVGFVEIISD